MANTGTFTYWLDGLPMVVIVKGTSDPGSFLYWADGLPTVSNAGTADVSVATTHGLLLMGVG